MGEANKSFKVQRIEKIRRAEKVGVRYMRRLSGRDKRYMLMEMINADITAQGGKPLNVYQKPCMVDDEEKQEIRHICNPALGLLRLPMYKYIIPEYTLDNRDMMQGMTMDDVSYEEYTVYFCPFCGKVYILSNNVF